MPYTIEAPESKETGKYQIEAPSSSALPGGLADIPHEIAQDWRAGRQEQREGVQEMERGTPGAIAKGAAKDIGGALGVIGSPITGTAKAVVNPVRNLLPHDFAGKLAGDTLEDAAVMFGPGAVTKGARMTVDVLPSLQKDVKMLMDAGVRMTPGQLLQGTMKRAEDSLKSYPLVGSFMRSAQRQSIEDFNIAYLNKALQNVGEKLPSEIEPGRGAIKATGGKLSDKYDNLAPKLTFQADPKLLSDIRSINLSRMPPALREQFKDIFTDAADRLSPQGSMDGRTYKKVESELSYISNRYLKSQDPAQHELGRAIGQLNGAMRDVLERSNPAHAKELKDLNTAWAMFKRAEGASIRRVKSNGVFSPTDLLSDIGKSATQAVFARGDALAQPFAEAGSQILPSAVPDSGTPERAGWMALLGGAGHFVSPPAAAAVGALTVPYTKPGMTVVNDLAKGAGGGKAVVAPFLAGSGTIDELMRQAQGR